MPGVPDVPFDPLDEVSLAAPLPALLPSVLFCEPLSVLEVAGVFDDELVFSPEVAEFAWFAVCPAVEFVLLASFAGEFVVSFDSDPTADRLERAVSVLFEALGPQPLRTVVNARSPPANTIAVRCLLMEAHLLFWHSLANALTFAGCG